jgi:hypothetical protein
MNKLTDPMKVVSGLEPAMLGRLADDGYRRNRHDDLAKMAAAEHLYGTRTAVRRRSAKPRWAMAGGGLVVGAVAAVAVAATIPAGHPMTARHHPAATGSARSFLLTSAVVAARSASATGTYWYAGQRDYEPAVASPVSRVKQDSKVISYGAMFAATEESWTGQARARTIVNEDLTITFATAVGKARWEAAGKPPLSTAAGAGVTAPVTSNYSMTLHWGVGGNQLTMTGMRKLPASAAALGRVLLRMWKGEPDKVGAVGFPDPTYTQYLMAWAEQLLTGPAQPGTKAAIFRLLAGQPGINLVKGVTDPLNRTGVAVGDGGGDYLVIDPGTAQPLAYVSHPVKEDSVIRGSGVEVYIAAGWTGQLGARP